MPNSMCDKAFFKKIVKHIVLTMQYLAYYKCLALASSSFSQFMYWNINIFYA